MKNLSWLLIAPLTLGLALTTACGTTTTPTADAGVDAGPQDSGPVTCGSDTMIDITGMASVHPVSAAIDPTLTMDGVTLSVEDPGLVLAGRDAILKFDDCSDATMALTADATTATIAPYAFAQVNTKKVSLGLIATMDDTDISGAKWVKSSMGLAGGPQTANLTVTTPAFVVAETTEAAFATFNSQTPGDLTAAGWIFGMFVDANSAPIDGVALVDGNGAAISQAFYPAVDGTTGLLSGVETDGNTSPAGIFVVSGLGLAEYAGSKAGITCTSQQAATSPGSVFVVMLVCQ